MVVSSLLATPPSLPLYWYYQPSGYADKGEELEASASEICKRSYLKSAFLSKQILILSTHRDPIPLPILHHPEIRGLVDSYTLWLFLVF